MTGQFSRFVRPGAQRVRVDDAGSGLKLTAYRDGGRVIVVVVNDGAAERAVTIRLANERAAGQMTAVRTSATEDWAALPPVAVSAGAFSTTFPAGSVTTLTTGRGR